MEKEDFENNSLEAEINISKDDENNSKWIDNSGEEVKQVFGFNSSAELVNGEEQPWWDF